MVLLIHEAIFAQTGRRFLNSNFQDDQAQYQYLMNNAIAAQEDLELVAGVSLTLAQIEALQTDIVWLEEQVVAGEKVLVPVVYLANVEEVRIEGSQIVLSNRPHKLLQVKND
jgi:filamentous hemagglutinin